MAASEAVVFSTRSLSDSRCVATRYEALRNSSGRPTRLWLEQHAECARLLGHQRPGSPRFPAECVPPQNFTARQAHVVRGGRSDLKDR